jgi:hypothetical protein
MVLISFAPFPPKRGLLLTLALLVFSAVTSFATPLLFSVKSTPYDRQMARIQPILNTPTANSHRDVSVLAVNHWIWELRLIPYRFSMEWKTPTELAHEPAADCKGKAVALYQRMRAHGAQDLRLVIGKRAPTSRSTHAWLEWTTASGVYVLDPTIKCCVQALNDIVDDSYVPYYAYAGQQKYRASTASALYAGL